MILYVFNVAGFLLAIAAIAWLSNKLAKKSRVLSGTENILDTVRNHTERQAEEIRGWRRLFGPFVSLYENSPEATSKHDNNEATIAVDLDGVITEYVEPWTGINHFGDPIPGAVESLKKLQELGYKIVVYTTRNNSLAHHNGGTNALELTALVQNHLEKHGIPYDYISLFKPLARIYVDDRAVRFFDWDTTMKNIKNLEVSRLMDRARLLQKATEAEPVATAPCGRPTDGCCEAKK